VGLLLCFVYINDLPKMINNKSKTNLFAGDTSIIGTYRDICRVFEHVNKWFKINYIMNNTVTHNYIFTT
jgi:hypothetical protein